ncbi:Leucine-rich repeat protein soc-2 like protein [Dufourea novaeangliae]|uniref:Leucine-rich repeat protein soc-2 like protein n=1 Tax=Dufourea novaeangliae TaxID=178035 RepID=A0A154P093_DUFNO|nr:Leucine-rich repeat protein soc-2 like protein [Dufourea novaeangliae]
MYSITQKRDSDTILTEDIHKQICELMQIQIIENLSFLGNQQYHLPNRLIECLSNLVYLNLSNSQLHDLPNSLNVLKKLKYLRIDSNLFVYIPNIVCELIGMRTLTACNNRIKDVPNNLNNLLNLEELDLNSNKLRNLPNSCSNLNQLKKLSLAHNKFEIIPSCVANGMRNLEEFKNLETVSLNETSFQKFDLPEEPLKVNIKMLSMKQCKLFETILRKITVGMTNLERLIIGNTGAYYGNSFWRMPIESLKEPSSLKEIDISGTGISLIPKMISNFYKLSIMNVSSNNITWLPEEICLLTNLTSLMIDKNNLMMLPKDIGKLVSLNELKAGYNNLYELPVTFEALNNLQYIDLYDNEFEIVPEVLTKLPDLIGLDLEENYFSTEDLLLDRSDGYEKMRNILRGHWGESNKTLRGAKLRLPEASESLSDSKESFSPYSFSSDVTIDNSLEEEALYSLPDGSVNEFANEHWDTSEDSADEFDPNEPREPKRRAYSPFTFYKPFQRVYCPAEFHETRVIHRIIQMLQEGTLVWSSSYAEGQFEDP